ncbi:sugar transferase [Fusobacterium sp. SB021]|uniref:sugar transferase n=1 Tax=Fusobacterium sp. SB021 TaxID=2744227 RepID=UPI003CEF6B25
MGHFLRKTSLDEFPQFLNVIKGEMSFVGPRPVVQKELDLYYGAENSKKIFTVKPGITGMWQANGRSDIENYDERIALDLYYIRNWSLWLDIIITIKTIKNVISKKGAY